MEISMINNPLKSFDGKPIIVNNDEQFTIKVALLNCLGSKPPKNGKESIEIYSLGCALYSGTKKSLSIEERALLKDAIEENKPGYTGIILGQLMLFLES